MEREFFSRVRKTVVPRPTTAPESDVTGQAGSVRASRAAIYGPNWYHDQSQDLIEIWDAGPALCFRGLIPPRDKYAREGLYLKLSLAYRTTEQAFVNLRTFSGNHVTLENSPGGAMYDDPHTIHWITDDCTININSIHRDERAWLQRVDWEWVSRETIYQDELGYLDPYLSRTPEQVAALYAEKRWDDDKVLELLLDRIRSDHQLARQCLLLAGSLGMKEEGLVGLSRRLELLPS